MAIKSTKVSNSRTQSIKEKASRKLKKASNRSTNEERVESKKADKIGEAEKIRCALCGKKGILENSKGDGIEVCINCAEDPDNVERLAEMAMLKGEEALKKKTKPDKIEAILNWELRHQLDKRLDEEPLYMVIKWAREQGLKVANGTLSEYNKRRNAEMVDQIMKGEGDQGSNLPSIPGQEPNPWATFFTQGKYSPALDNIGVEMNFLNGIIRTAEHRLIKFPMLVDPTELMKAAINAIKVKSSIMGPEAYQFEKHLESLQEQVTSILQIVNEECDSETRVKIFGRIQELQVKEMRKTHA